MEYALAISVIANIVLAVLWFRRTRFYYCRFLFWFRKRPDFAKVEETARRLLRDVAFAELLAFDRFEGRDWMGDLAVRYKAMDREHHDDTWQAIQNLVSRLSRETGLPCWPYGWTMDKDNPRLSVGSIIGIGYGTCGCGRDGKEETEQEDGEATSG